MCGRGIIGEGIVLRDLEVGIVRTKGVLGGSCVLVLFARLLVGLGYLLSVVGEIEGDGLRSGGGGGLGGDEVIDGDVVFLNSISHVFQSGPNE